MRKVSFLIFLMPLIFLGCLLFKDQKYIYLDQGLVSGRVSKHDSLEDGRWTYKDSLGREISKGSYENGKLKGNWVYLVNEKNFSVNWKVHEDTKIVIPYPDSWSLNKGENLDFIIYPNSEDKGSFFYTLGNDLSNYPDFDLESGVIQQLDTFLNIYENNESKGDIIKETSSEKTFYILRCSGLKDGKQEYHFAYFFRFDKFLVEIGVFFDDKYEYAQISEIYTEMVANTFIRGNKIFSPFEEFTSRELIER